MLSLWTRPTIPFKLECESPNIKHDILQEIQKTTKSMNGDTEVAWTAIFFAIWTLTILCCSNGCLLAPYVKTCDDKDDAEGWQYIMTVLISVQAFAGVFFMYWLTKPLLAFPGRRGETIENLKLIRTLINDCSDDLTQVYTPGPTEYLEEDENMFRIYVLIVIVWFYLIALCAYGLWNGIISHILFLCRQEKKV